MDSYSSKKEKEKGKLVLKLGVMSSSGIMYPYASKKIYTTHKTFIN